jgi:prepilin-type N-terminal cleavage/methylation domain-containing protein
MESQIAWRKEIMDIKGFTLIELITTVVIVSLLAAIAIPVYSSYIQRGRMAKAYADIKLTCIYNERCFAQNGSYGNWLTLSTSFGLTTEVLTQNQQYYNLRILRYQDWDISANSIAHAGNHYIAMAIPIENAFSRTPCMRSDGIQGYMPAGTTVDNISNRSFDSCAQEEWKGK